jgi:hypothetical protein
VRRKAKALKDTAVTSEKLSETLTTILLAEGAWVLRERHGFTAPQVLEWAMETTARARDKVLSGQTYHNVASGLFHEGGEGEDAAL